MFKLLADPSKAMIKNLKIIQFKIKSTKRNNSLP